MTWNVNDQEFASVIRLPAPKRYSYFLKKVSDWRQLWSLATVDGWAEASDDAVKMLVPIWPHERFAKACATAAWQDYEPRRIDLDVWIEHWIPGMTKDGKEVAVFPTPDEKGVVVPPERLFADLSQELAQYE
jgi:hypothetical protein